MNESELRQVLCGEPKAVRDFVRQYGPLLRAVVRRRLHPPLFDREEDVLQDLFLKLFKDDAHVLRKWDPAKGISLRSYLVGFAEMLTLDYLRKHLRQSRQPQESMDCMDERDVLLWHAREYRDLRTASWLETLLERFRDSCTADEWRFFELSFLEECSIQDLSQMFAITADAVHQRRYRLRMRLLALRERLSAEDRTA